MVSKRPKVVFNGSAKWHSGFVNNLPVGVCRTTLEGNIVFCNMVYAEIFGFDSVKELVDYPVINLYHDKRKRGHLIKAVTERGYAKEVRIPFKKKNGELIWCAVTAKAILDDDGIVVFLDEVIRDITEEIKKNGNTNDIDDVFSTINDFFVILDLEGNLIDINKAGAGFLGFKRDELLGKPLVDFVAPDYRDLLQLFVFQVSKSGKSEGIITILDREEKEHHLEFYGYLIKKEEKSHYIRGIGRDVTERIEGERKRLINEKFQGVLEMAGGVAHKMNQPLMIINNLLKEMLSDMPPEDDNHPKVVSVHNQIKKLNEIAKKIRGINKYEAMDYVGGIKIVDIDKAS